MMGLRKMVWCNFDVSPDVPSAISRFEHDSQFRLVGLDRCPVEPSSASWAFGDLPTVYPQLKSRHLQ